MYFTIRVLIDTEEKKDCYRDMNIASQHTLSQLHDEIMRAFGFGGTEMASFYSTDEDWNQKDEYPQMDFSGNGRSMETSVSEFFRKKGDRLLYVYDFLRMWCFMIEVINTHENEVDELTTILEVGTPPAEDSKEMDLSFESTDESTDDSWEEEDEWNNMESLEDIDPDEFSEYQ